MHFLHSSYHHQTLYQIFAIYLRVGMFVAGAGAIFWVAERRYNVVSKFFAEQRTALDLAVFRVAVMALYLQFPLGLGRRFAGLDRALIVPPPGWGVIARWFPRSPGLYEAVTVVFLVTTVLGLIGLWTRFAVPLAVAAGFYVFTVPQLFGKINHNHEMVLFGILLALSPCGDALSVDAWLRRRRGKRVPALMRSARYGLPLNFVMLLMGVIYFFPGAWKVARNGAHWFTAENLGMLISSKLAETGPTWVQVWILHHPALLTVGAFATIVFEVGWIFAVMNRRTRWVAFVVGLGFHSFTRLSMNIGFYEMQACYTALIDWGGVAVFLQKMGVMRIRVPVQRWVRGGVQMVPTGIDRAATIRVAGGAMVVGMVLFGWSGVTSWPLGCYPRFETAKASLLRATFVEAKTVNGQVLQENLTFDRQMENLYSPERWRGMADVECYGNGSPTGHSRALIELWRRTEGVAEIGPATIVCNQYDMGLPGAPLVESTVVGEVDMAGGR